MSIKKLDAKIKEIRSQSSEKIGLRLGGSLFESLEHLGRLSESEFVNLPNDPEDKNLINVIDFKMLDSEFLVLKINDDSYSIEIAPRPDCLVHINAD